MVVWREKKYLFFDKLVFPVKWKMPLTSLPEANALDNFHESLAIVEPTDFYPEILLRI